MRTKTAASVPAAVRKRLLDEKRWDHGRKLHTAATQLADELDSSVYPDHNAFATPVDQALKDLDVKLSAADKKTLARPLVA